MSCRADLLRKFLQLASWERRLLARAWIILHLIAIALRFLPFQTVLTWCQGQHPYRLDQAEMHQPLSLARCAWLVDVAGRYSLMNTTCLVDTLAMAWLLRRQGVATTVKLGVAQSNGSLTAHAWLERNGQIVFNHATTVAYAPLHPCAARRSK